MNDDADFDSQLRSLMAADRKIEAIKLYRQRTGAGLAEAKEAVEALAAGQTPSAVPRGTCDADRQSAALLEKELEQDLVALLEQGRMIEAIKLYRAHTGVGLKDAKDAVDAIAARHHIPPQRGCGCLGAICLLVATLVTALAALAAPAGEPLAGQPLAPVARPEGTETRPAVLVSGAQRDDLGALVHRVESPYQAGPTQVRVLGPDRIASGRRYPAVYVLPVEPLDGSRYGDGLREVKRRDLANKHQAFFVAPTFSDWPWYADHPTDRKLRQETHFLAAVTPSVESRYPVEAKAEGRLLLGFSKSGWGAMSLLLRHPEVFGKAAAFDAPLMQDKPDRFGMNAIFATDENFQKYRLADLLEKREAGLREDPRLILLGYGNFREDHRRMHRRMQELGIAHRYRDGPARTHDWHSGWVEEAVELLLRRDAKP